MPIHASPGVYFETIDFSLYAPKLSKTILALVGKSSKGPTEPTYVTSVRQFTDLFGAPRKGDFSALAAVSFLEFGSSLWYKRLVGASAAKATVEIPRAYEITDELLVTMDDTGEYIVTGTLANSPVPGTLEIKVVDPNDATNYILITDDGEGAFSAYTNNGVSQYANFIDYDTGEFRFTLETATDTDVVSVRYNYREFTVASEVAKTVVTPDAGRTYSGILSHPNIVSADTTFSLVIAIGAETHTFTTTGAMDEGTKTYTLVGKDSGDITSGSGSLVITTGVWSVTFIEGTNAEAEDVFLANYKYSTFKLRTLGTVGEANPAGGEYGAAYIGNLGTVITPSSVSILVDDVVVSTDNGLGRFVTGVVAGTNTVNYSTKAVNLALVTPPEDGFEVYASYMAKYTHILDTIGEGGSTGGSVSATVTMFPIIKGSVEVTIGTDTLADDGDGNLTGTGANGTVDYDTGIINVNYTQTLVEGDEIAATYLSKLGDATALYEGASYDGIKLEFYKDPFYGYGLKVWNSSQLITQTPEENWKDLNFTDDSSVKYFMNKVTSNLVELELYDNTVFAVPVLNSVLTLTGGSDDESHVTSSVAATALGDFSNAETYDINLVACPDFPGDKTVSAELIQLCEVERGDCFAIIDPPQSLTVQQVVNWHNGDGQWANENALNSSFAALYYPWIQVTDQFTESLEWVPPSVRIVSVYAYSDSKAEVWNAPAGLNRGKLFKVQKVERNLTVGDRDLLYATGSNAINPICDFVGDGIVVYGQKTLQRASTSLNRVNVMRMILYVTKILATATKYLLFEPNDSLTWILYGQLVNPLIEDIKQKRGLYEFQVVCDETTNTASDIDDNTMVAEVWMKPTKTAERLINRFVITSTGASFTELDSI